MVKVNNMGKRLCLIGLGLMIAISGMMAQAGIVRGNITDASYHEVLPGTNVSVGSAGTVADVEGNYMLSLPAGNHQLMFSYIGYQSVVKEVTIQAGDTLTLNIALLLETSVLKTATVTSGKFARLLSEETVSLEVLKPGLINNTGKVSLDKALEKIPGFTIIDGQANIRGGSGFSQGAGSRVLLLVDDMPILQADAGYPNWNDVPVENIEQVEVLKGAASALYGSSALNGVVNVRTAGARSVPVTGGAFWAGAVGSPRDKSQQWWGSDTLASPATIGVNMYHRQRLGKLDVVLGAFYQNTQSHNKDTYDEYGRVNVSLKYHFHERLYATVSGNLNQGRTGSFFYWNGESQRFQGAPTTISQRDRLRFNIDPQLTYYDKQGNKHRFLSRYFSVDNDNQVSNGADQSNTSYVVYSEYQFQRNFKALNMVFTSGLVGTWNSVTAQLYGDTTFSSRNLAAYAQADKKIGPKLNASLGIRLENNVLFNPGFSYLLGTVEPSEEEETKPVIRAGLNYALAKATFLRASWGQGYRYPTVAERYIFTNAGFFILPNPNSSSETAWSAELGLKQGIRIGGFEGFVDLAAFYSRFYDMLEFNLVGFGFSSQNVGQTDISGAEITILGKGKLLGVPMGILTGYTLIDPNFLTWDPRPIEPGSTPTLGQLNYNNSSEKGDNVLKYRSRHTFKFDLETQWPAFNFGIETFYASHLAAIDFIFLAIVPGLRQYRDQNNQGFLVNNLRTSYQFNHKVKLSLFLNNILNEDYTVRPGLMEAPRNIQLRVDWKL